MLFDLRGRGRRRTVQVIYLGLAILFGLGFVGFGVGGGFGGGGIFDAFSNKEGSSSASYSGQVSAAEKRTRISPNDPAVWAALAGAQVHEAGGAEFYSEGAGGFTSKGKVLLSQVATSWSRYLALNPPHPDVTLAQEMLRVFGAEGLNQPSAAVQVLQIVIPARPASAALYGDLALYSYEAKNPREGDLAEKKAIALTPAAQRPQLVTELAQVKRSPSGSTRAEAPSAASGKTYNVAPGSSTTTTATPKTPATNAPSKKK